MRLSALLALAALIVSGTALALYTDDPQPRSGTYTLVSLDLYGDGYATARRDGLTRAECRMLARNENVTATDVLYTCRAG